MKLLFITILITIAHPLAELCAADRKPNFIFIIADDHRWDAMGAVQKEQGEKARYPWLETPSMDRLAAQGVRFRNAFITHSICSPGRAGFLTGQYTHTVGVMTNSTPFPEDAVTHATLLRDAGYQTAYFGKWHMGDQRARPGFGYSASFIDQGIYQNCPVVINGIDTPTQGWIDDVSTDFAIDWIKKNSEQPFSIVLGFKSPHNKRGNENLPERLRHLYEGKTTRRTPNCDIAAVYHKPVTEADKGKERGLSANSVHLDYLRHIKGIDENLGRLLDSLDELKLADDTVVVYSSDNGYFLGERGLGDKRALYEEGLRIPFIVRYPRLFPKGRLVDEMVINQDLAPTWLDLAGLPANTGMHGASFKELARGNKPADWRTSFLSYYRKELGDTPTCYAVRTTTHKLVRYPNRPEWTELFDLAADPYELKNLAADASLTAKLDTELDALMKKVNYAVPVNANKPPAAAPDAAILRETREVSGWQVHIQKRLLAAEPADTEHALVLLKKMLDEIIEVVPAAAVTELRKVPLYFSPAYKPGQSGAEFHPGADWLRDNGRDPAMARCVEFSGVHDFEAEMKRMPNFALHELAHAYHFRVLKDGFENADLKAAYARAKASGSYDQVERSRGDGSPSTTEKAYAMTDPMEYFAEATEAFFVRNDFYPFNREELKKHDPKMLDMVEKFWTQP